MNRLSKVLTRLAKEIHAADELPENLEMGELVYFLNEAAAEIERGQAAIEGLKFYANPENWTSQSKGFALQYDPAPSPVHADKGAKARALVQPGSS